MKAEIAAKEKEKQDKLDKEAKEAELKRKQDLES
jgi:hypothetical protein